MALGRCFAAGLSALAVTACTPTPLLGRLADAPLTANLPLNRAGVRDERAAFSALFARELKDLGMGADPSDWLYSAPGASFTPDDLANLDRRFADRHRRTAVMVVPGLFGDCIGDQSIPFGDGIVRSEKEEIHAAYDIYADLGLADVRLVPLRGRADSSTNGAQLAQMLRAQATRPGIDRIVLLAYSKGLPDALEGLADLQSNGGIPPAVKALVSVAGAVLGTPLADYYQETYNNLAAPLSLWECSTSTGGELASLTRAKRLDWLAAHPLPDGLSYYSVVAYATGAMIAPALRHTHALLDASDPRNDGQLIAADAILPGSTVLAATRTDHWDIALPLGQSNHALVRALASGRDFPRAALFRALVRWSVAQSP